MSTGVFPLLFLVGFSGQPWQRDLTVRGAAGRVGRVGGPGKGVQGASSSPSSRAGSGGARLGLVGPGELRRAWSVRRHGWLQLRARGGPASPPPSLAAVTGSREGARRRSETPGRARGPGGGVAARDSTAAAGVGGWRMNEGRLWAPEAA